MTERIRLSGRLDADGHLTLRPAFPTAIPPERWRQETLAYVVEVLDAQGRPLARVPLSASGTCESSSTSLRGSVDLPEGAARLDVLHVDASGRDPIVLASEPIPDRAPELRLLAVPEGEVKGEFTLTWEARAIRRPFGTSSTTAPAARRGSRSPWVSASPGSPSTSTAWPAAPRCRLAVTASNGLRATRVETGPFSVREKPCAAVILRPVDGEELPPDVVLVGNGWWREEGRPELQALMWASDVQGELGRGRQVTAQPRAGDAPHHAARRHGGSGG